MGNAIGATESSCVFVGVLLTSFFGHHSSVVSETAYADNSQTGGVIQRNRQEEG